MSKTGTVAIIVLNYNNPVATIRCLNSLKLLLEGETLFDTIVVDNGSTDNSVDQIRLNYPEINLVESKKNLGFAGGNNLGIKEALKEGYPYVLLLNNDTLIIDGSMLDKLISTGTNLVGPVIKFQRDSATIVDYGGAIDQLKGRNTHHEYDQLEVPETIPSPDYLSGTCMLVKAEVFITTGLLDDHYFLYYEDVDFCLRAKKAGFSLSVCPETEIYHELSASSNKLGKQKIKILATSHRRFFMKYLSPLAWPFAFAYNLYLTTKAS